MSENPNTNNPEEDDDGGLFCQKLNPCLRKVLYYLTFGIGAILFLIGCVVVFFGSEGCVIAGSVLILIAPFWIKSLKKCFFSFKDLIKLTSFLIYFVFFCFINNRSNCKMVRGYYICCRNRISCLRNLVFLNIYS